MPNSSVAPSDDPDSSVGHTTSGFNLQAVTGKRDPNGRYLTMFLYEYLDQIILLHFKSIFF